MLSIGLCLRSLWGVGAGSAGLGATGIRPVLGAVDQAGPRVTEAQSVALAREVGGAGAECARADCGAEECYVMRRSGCRAQGACGNHSRNT